MLDKTEFMMLTKPKLWWILTLKEKTEKSSLRENTATLYISI